LSELSGFADLKDFQRTHLRWIEQGLENGLVVRDDSWSEAIAVGSRSFVEKVKSELGFKAAHREVIEAHGSSHFANRPKLTESNLPLKVRALRSQNTFLWDETVDETRL
jgi:hypothetical protein